MLFFVVFDGGSLLAVVKAAVTRVVSGNTLVAATVGSAREGSARADSVGNSTAGVASAEASDCAEVGITVTVNNTATAVLDAALRCVVELIEVTVSTSDSAGNLDISGVVGIVGNITLVIDELFAIVVVVSSVVPGTEVVGPAAISEVFGVLVTIGVGAGTISEGVSAHALGVADVTGGVLVTLVAEASLLLSEVVVVVARDGVKGDVDLAGVVAPLVINGFLGVPMVVGSPLVPCVVNPLVVALTLMADLSVGVVLISDVPSLLTKTTTEGSSLTESGTVGSSVTTKSDSAATIAAVAMATVSTEATNASEALKTTERVDAMTATSIGSVSIATLSEAALSNGMASDTVAVVGSLMAVVLVVSTVSFRLDSVVVGSLPGLGGNDSASEKNSLEHCKVKFSRLYFSVKISPFK